MVTGRRPQRLGRGLSGWLRQRRLQWVRLVSDDRRFGLLAGQVVQVRPYRWDPECKFTVFEDGEPAHNLYRHQVKALDGSRFRCGCCPTSP